jgi:hypothetical protein
LQRHQDEPDRLPEITPLPQPLLAQENPIKAIVHDRYGSSDVLERKDIKQPVINDDQVLVRSGRPSAAHHDVRGLRHGAAVLL